jgi:tetratricopeptide (TPR) repeat protein
MALFVSDHLEEARDALDAGLAEAQRRGSVPMFVQMSEFRAGVALRMGDLDVAEDHAQRAYELGGELGLKHWPMTYLLPILLERGRAEEALRVIATLPLGEPELRLWPGVMVLAHRGCAHVVRGDLRAGVADLLDADRRMAAGRCDLSVCIDWVATAAPALAALGREDEARALTARELAAARAFGAPRRYGVALSACGPLDPDPLGLERLREAVALLDGTPARLDHARALVNLGAGLRERGESAEARRVLARGMDIAHQGPGNRVHPMPISVAWCGDGAPRMEVAHVERSDSGLTAVGTQIGPVYELRYRLEPTRLHLEVVGQRSLEVDLADADFFDLGFSPLFNSLPVIRDKLLEAGPARSYEMRWIDVPSLAVSISEQRYEPLGNGQVRFSSADFTSDIRFDEAGFVLDYPGIGTRVLG